MSRLLSANLVRAGVASGWIVSGRLVGLAWTAELVARLGIGSYGQYAVAFALAAIIAAPLDNPFGVRSLRIDDARFRAERTARLLLGVLLLVAGVIVYPSVFLAGFALVVAGGEIAFNALKSGALRDGYPDRVQRWDVFRQAASILAGSACLFLVPGAGLELASAGYLAPYLVVAVLSAARVARVAPRLPMPPREAGLLFVDALALAAYVQGDILLLGVLAGSAAAGIYSLASLVCLALASFAGMYAQTFHERLRLAGGHPDAGPPRRNTSLLAGVLGLVVLGLGLAVLGAGIGGREASTQLGVALVIMSAFAALRSGTLVAQTILYLQGGDLRRVLGAVAAAILKLSLVAVLASLGAVGAAIACVLAEILLLAWFTRLAYFTTQIPLPLVPHSPSKGQFS